MEGDVLLDGVFHLKNFPLSPTDNHMYITVRRGSKMWRAPSADSKRFQLEVDRWGWQNMKILLAPRALAKQAKPLQIDLMLKLKPSRLWTKKGLIKRFDATNRLKATLDQLAKLLECDDSQFFAVSVVKIPEENEGVDILVRAYL